jgi:hypothetical protein
MRSMRRGGSSLLIVLILATGAFLFVWMYHPGVLNALLKSGLDGTTKTTAPVDAAQLAKTKEDRWQSVYRPHPVCGRERTELERLECRNDYDNQRAQFEAQWRAEMARSAKH